MAKKKKEDNVLKIFIEREPTQKSKKPYVKVFESKRSQLTYINFYPTYEEGKKTNGEKWKPSTITDGIGVSSNKNNGGSSRHVHPRAYNDSKVPEFFAAVCVDYDKSRDLYQFNAQNEKDYYLEKTKCQNQTQIQKGKKIKIHIISQSPKYRVLIWDWK